MKTVKKKASPKKVNPSTVNESDIVYAVKKSAKQVPALPDFLFTDFKAVADKSPFSLADWASLLHVSERTLQRYAKDNSAFNGLQIERILHLENLIDAGNDTFGAAGFGNWLDQKPFSLGGATVKEYLGTHAGIQAIIDLLGRIAHGIPA